MPSRAPIPFEAIPILASLRAEDREALAPLCEMRGYEKGETIFREGDPGERIHFVFLGRVKIVKAGPGRDLILEILGPGEPVGAVAAFERKPFPATAIAIEASGIVSIPERQFFDLLGKRPEITRRLFAGLTMRLMNLNRHLADMLGSVEYRAARLFLTLAGKMGQKRGGGVFIPVALSRQELADLIGTTIETAIRVMSRWQKDGLVETEKTGFLIPRPQALKAIVSDE